MGQKSHALHKSVYDMANIGDSIKGVFLDLFN